MDEENYYYLGIQKIKKWYLIFIVPLAAISLFLMIPKIDDLIVIIFYGFENFSNGLYLQNSKNGILSDGSNLKIEANIVRSLFLLFILFFSGFIMNCIVKIFLLLFTKGLKKNN